MFRRRNQRSFALASPFFIESSKHKFRTLFLLVIISVLANNPFVILDVFDISKILISKQITTTEEIAPTGGQMYSIFQRY